jgi:hypothetical protein
MDEWMYWSDARITLCVSRDKMSQLVKTGTIGSKLDPLDKRVKLVKRADVERLFNESMQRKRNQKTK